MEKILKRVLDAGLAGWMLVALCPVMLIIALAIRNTSAGGALFRQARLGKDGIPYSILKFRTMYEDAVEIRNADGSAFSSAKDRRVTRLGQWLRGTSLDELPQLWNVLVGEMSLVGPRPDQVDQLGFYTEQERRKLLVRPGMTGLAQISGRNRMAWQKRKVLDVKYVDNWSLLLDLRILAQTIPYVLLRRDINEENSNVHAADCDRSAE
ncbi:MAG TPA: sugar transferase [Bryobacteraceae bacterium]|nr:sugar transferase [Bryobacteraceae bacterium]